MYLENLQRFSFVPINANQTASGEPKDRELLSHLSFLDLCLIANFCQLSNAFFERHILLQKNNQIFMDK